MEVGGFRFLGLGIRVVGLGCRVKDLGPRAHGVHIQIASQL